MRKTCAQTCDARMGALVPVLMEVANAQRVSPGVPARSMLTSAKEIHVGVTACALIAWVSTSVLAMQDTAGKIVISQINVLPGNTAPMKARSSAAQAMESSVGRQESAPAYAAMASRGTTVRYHQHVLQETRAFQAQLHVPLTTAKSKAFPESAK